MGNRYINGVFACLALAALCAAPAVGDATKFKLFGKEYTKQELLSRVGDISQIAGVKLCTRDDGPERGVRTVEFRTGSGLTFTVLLDRGMDISNAEFNGQAIAWRSSTGDVSPAHYDEPGLGWFRSFHGGLLNTCGLTYNGAPCVDQGKPLGLHGRASNLPAYNVSADAAWQDGKYVMWMQGKIRETTVFGENVEMCRKITARLGESKIWVHDTVTNLGYKDTDHMMLYHCNIGFPVVDQGSRLIAPVASYAPRDADAEVEKELYASIPGPTAGWKERVYYHEMAPDAEGYVTAAMVNPNFNNGQGFGVYLKFPKKELPCFVEWKQAGEGTYVVGMEPANCWAGGRAKERERGTLQTLKPGEAREYHLEIGVLSSQHEIQAIEKTIKSLVK
ncbi:MAG: aldose 1-epimerase family protein [Armatimonadota bacterium]